jgi:purine-cytosine permease-like protein
LKNLFVISTTTNAHNDAMNMAQVTGLPPVLWIFIWIGISILMISIGLRVYAVSQKGKQYDLPFED